MPPPILLAKPDKFLTTIDPVDLVSKVERVNILPGSVRIDPRFVFVDKNFRCIVRRGVVRPEATLVLLAIELLNEQFGS